MSGIMTRLPSRRPGLVIRSVGKDAYVVKDPETGGYFQLGEREHFLLTQFDGRRTGGEIRRGFRDCFDEELYDDELDEFLEAAQAQGLLTDSGAPVGSCASGTEAKSTKRKTQSLFYWRTKIFDPDRFFTWLAPKVGCFWTRTFLIVSACCIVIAALLVCANRVEIVASWRAALRWETALLVWLTLLVVAMLHEFAHGLTCKHYGGQVHEIGFLLLF